MAIQLPLGISLRAEASFANYVTVGNEQSVTLLSAPQEVPLGRALDKTSEERVIYLWGAHATGKTHLLQACCHQRAERNQAVCFIPLAEYHELDPSMLEGLETMDLVCIDDLQAIAGELRWEEALFHLFNRLYDQRKRLIMTASAAPSGLTLSLNDLTSRLNSALICHLLPLNDAAKLEVLQRRAAEVGMELPLEVGHYLLRHASRDLTALLALLQQLDHASLVRQRRLTIPLVKEVLNA